MLQVSSALLIMGRKKVKTKLWICQMQFGMCLNLVFFDAVILFDSLTLILNP